MCNMYKPIYLSDNYPLSADEEIKRIEAEGIAVDDEYAKIVSATVTGLNAAYFAGQIDNYNSTVDPMGGCSYTEFLLMDAGYAIYAAGLRGDPGEWQVRFTNSPPAIAEKLEMLANTINTYFRVQYDKGLARRKLDQKHVDNAEQEKH